MTVACDRWREAISARADGEDPGVDPRLIDTHVARCPACRSFRDSAERPMPDLGPRVASLAAAADRAGASPIARGVLLVAAIEILVFSFPALVLGDEQDTARHAARHLGAFAAAYAVGLLAVVIRPARARAMLPVAAVLGGALLLGTVVDLVERRVPFFNEALHLPELISVLLLWLIARPTHGRDVASEAKPVRLRVVESSDPKHRDAG